MPTATSPDGRPLLAPEGATIYARDHEHLDLDSTARERTAANLAADGVAVDEHDSTSGADVGRTPPRAGGQPDRAWQPVPGGGIV